MKTLKTLDVKLDPVLGLRPLVCVQEPFALVASIASKSTIAQIVAKVVEMIKIAVQVHQRYHIN